MLSTFHYIVFYFLNHLSVNLKIQVYKTVIVINFVWV
jgi:hypothetical protein